MAVIDSNTIAEIKSKLSIVDIISRYIELRPVGDRWSAPCPFHEETKPSFTVSPDKGFYYCFGCQAAGDIIEFYKNINGLDFSEAVRQLASEAGVEISLEKSEENIEKKNNVSIAQEINSLAGKFFMDCLWSSQGEEARKYLSARKISQEIVRSFRLGWSPDGWQELTHFLGRRKFSPEHGVMAGVLSQNNRGRIYDRFRARLIFPIISLSGMVVAFGGRVIGEGEPKYLNSSENPVYTKGEHLYGLYQARKHITQTRKVFLTEGYLDVLALHQYGFANSCGVLGTALTRAQVRRLSGLCREVIVLFDGDQAGRKAAFRSAAMILSAGLKCQVLNFPDSEDAHSILVQNGAEHFDELLKQTDEGLRYCLSFLNADSSPKEMMAWVNGFLGGLKDFSLKTYYIPKVAGLLGLTETELRKGLKDKQPGKRPPRAEGKDNENVHKPCLRDLEILTFAVCFPEYRNHLDQKNLDIVLSSSWSRTFWNKIKTKSDKDEEHGFDAGELDFYYRARMQESSLKVNKEEIFNELSGFIDENYLTLIRQNYKQALIRAQKNNDKDEIKRILRMMQSVYNDKIKSI